MLGSVFLTLDISILEKVRLIWFFLLVGDMFLMLGSFKFEVISVIDIRNAFHSLRLMDESKKYCGI